MALANEHDPEGDDIYQNLDTVHLPEHQQKGKNVRAYSRYRLTTGVLGILCVALLMAVIGMAVLSLNVGPCKSCPSGWKARDHTCFYFPDLNSTIRLGWKESRADCVQRGGQLAAVDTLEKQKFISQILNARHKTFKTNGYWIGLRDKVNGQTWTWMNGFLLTEGYWMDGEPNNYIYTNEDCAATYPTNNPLKSWNDAYCTHLLRWICEKEAT